MQWLSAGFGGYLAGRLRAKWIGPRTDEVLFRDTAHGLLAWALATVIVAALLTLGTLGTTAAVIATGSPPAADAAAAAATVSEEAREAAANFSIVTAISLLVGGFIGAVAGALGGYHRDEL
jgi:predicted permease